MPHRRWSDSMEGSNTGLTLSHDYSNYLATTTPDNSDEANQHFDYPLTFPWSCENGGCSCSDLDSLSEKHVSQPSTTDSSTTAESSLYITHPYLSPTNTGAIAMQQIKEGLCPLATGATAECVPQLCGANPPCQAFWSAPEIEECGDVPCVIKPEDRSGASLQLSSSSLQVRRSSPSAKRSCRDAGQTTSKPRNLTSGSSMSTIAEVRLSESPKHHKKQKQPAPFDTKQAHSLVEKRYRENLNAKISELNNVLSCSTNGTPSPDNFSAKKSEVLQAAIDYVNQSQLEMRHMTNDINRLNARVKTLERQADCDDCSILKNFDVLRMIPRRSSSTMNGVGASYNMAAISAG